MKTTQKEIIHFLCKPILSGSRTARLHQRFPAVGSPGEPWKLRGTGRQPPAVPNVKVGDPRSTGNPLPSPRGNTGRRGMVCRGWRPGDPLFLALPQWPLRVRARVWGGTVPLTFRSSGAQASSCGKPAAGLSPLPLTPPTAWSPSPGVGALKDQTSPGGIFLDPNYTRVMDSQLSAAHTGKSALSRWP